MIYNMKMDKLLSDRVKIGLIYDGMFSEWCFNCLAFQNLS